MSFLETALARARLANLQEAKAPTQKTWNEARL